MANHLHSAPTFLWTNPRNFLIPVVSCIVGGGFFRVELASSNRSQFESGEHSALNFFRRNSQIPEPQVGSNQPSRRPLNYWILLLFLATAGCAAHQSKSTFVVAGENQTALSDVTVLADPTFTAPTLNLALDQVNRPKAPVVGTLAKPATSALQALPSLQKIARRPIVAVTEYQNWLWFATDVTRDENTKAVNTFISGYALQKGGVKVLKWNVG